MTPHDPNLLGSADLDAREERLGELLNSFLDRRQRGEAVTEEQFLAEHAEDAEELREHFRSLNLIQGLGSSGAGRLRRDSTLSAIGSSANLSLQSNSAPIPRIEGYEVTKQIGRGGMGVVYKAIQKSTNRVVALKVLLDGPFATEAAQQRFQREISLAAKLRHSHIIPIYDSGIAEGRMYYAMEHIYGVPLDGYVRAHKLAIDARLRLFIKVCDGIGHAHQRGVVHRDLKPSNILVDGDGQPHVLDFGLAKAGSIADVKDSMTAQIIGTPAYMSPEQVLGDPSGIDTRSDVYSLGVVLYEVLTDQMPYDTTGPIGRTLTNIAHADPAPPSRHNAEIDADLDAIILKSLEKGKEKRYQSVDALRSDLANYLEGDPILAKPAGPVALVRKMLWKHRMASAMIAGLVLTVGVSSIAVRVMGKSVKSKSEQLNIKEDTIHDLEEVVAQKQAEVAKLEEDRQRLTEALVQEKQARAQLVQLLVKMVGPEHRAVVEALLPLFGADDGDYGTLLFEKVLRGGTKTTEMLMQLGKREAGASSQPVEGTPDPPGTMGSGLQSAGETGGSGGQAGTAEFLRLLDAFKESIMKTPGATGSGATTQPGEED